MLVPRAYLSRPGLEGSRDAYTDKQKSRLAAPRPANKSPVPRSATSQSSVPLRARLDQSPPNVSSPVQIPQASQRLPLRPSAPLVHAPGPPHRASTGDMGQGKESPSASGAAVESLLSATNIRGRRKPRRNKAQKLPQGDHVASFSRLLLEDVAGVDARPPSSSSSSSLANPHLEELLGHSADHPSPLRDASGASSPLLPHSMSSESMPSLVTDDDAADRSVISEGISPISPTQRLSPNPQVRLLSFSEECGDDHPLRQINVLDPLSAKQHHHAAFPHSPRPPADAKRRSSSLRSNLTASLRALRSAAQTVSSLATTAHVTQPEDFITRSIFTFVPQLTDDKRPPPSAEPPSPALRRYLNPHSTVLGSGSAAELHACHEPRSRHRVKASGRRGRPTTSIQLQTCIPSANRSAHASSPPTWLNTDGTDTTTSLESSSSSTSSSSSSSLPSSTPSSSSSSSTTPSPPHLPRPRELRENAAFLRVLVAEMNMRRSGKFDDDMHSHARLCLPPRKPVDPATAGRTPRERWADLSAV